MKKQKDWFKLKRYPHIGFPLTVQDRAWVTTYVTNPDKVKKHAFFPFIHRTSTRRKFRKSVDRLTGERSLLRHATSKPRELFYANHLDACVYSYYAHLLQKFYEEKLTSNGLQNVVTAYRSIKMFPADVDSVHKSSADFAAEVFSFILQSKAEDLVAITFDIKGFFDNLCHQRLKRAWCEISNSITLTPDEYNVFNNIVNYSFVNEKQLFSEFKDEIIVETKTGIRKAKKIKKLHHMRNQGAIAFCKAGDLKRIKNKNLIVGNLDGKYAKRIKGIPQGSPISAVLANVYMFHFDKKINSLVGDVGGMYRRYSDDMIVICEKCHAENIIREFDLAISERDLEIQHNKTQIFHFHRYNNKYNCVQQYEEGLHHHKNLEYLGFEFDGYNSFLKSSSLSSFYRKMKRSIHRCNYYAKTLKSSKSKGLIFKTRLYKKFSYKGAERRRIYIQDKKDSTNWLRTDSYNWGNYISYAHLGANKLPNNKIKNQIKRHWKILNKLIAV